MLRKKQGGEIYRHRFTRFVVRCVVRWETVPGADRSRGKEHDPAVRRVLYREYPKSEYPRRLRAGSQSVLRLD